MSRVFVVQEPVPNKHNWVPDLRPAQKFGELIYIFKRDERIPEGPAEALWVAEDCLQDFDPTKDFILWPNACDPLGIVVVMLALRFKSLSQLRILSWERGYISPGERSSKRGYYTPVTIPLTN